MEKQKESQFEPFRNLSEFSLLDLELVRLILRGGSILDWHRLNFAPKEIETFCRVHLIDLKNPDDQALIERIRNDAIEYLSETFDFPIPKPIRTASLTRLLKLASDTDNRHRQFCACIVLKAMHIINHYDASEARQALRMTDQEIFQAAERRIYQAISHIMANDLPIIEFKGGRKPRGSMMTKLLSKNSPLSAQLFDKLRFRIITATIDDVFPIINYLARNLFPFNYSIADESFNTLLPFGEYSAKHSNLARHISKLQVDANVDNQLSTLANRFSSEEYRVAHWVADMPLRIPQFQKAYRTDGINPVPRPIIYTRVELQIFDRHSHQLNESGRASHRQYKLRQVASVANRLKLGLRKPA